VASLELLAGLARTGLVPTGGPVSGDGAMIASLVIGQSASCSTVPPTLPNEAMAPHTGQRLCRLAVALAPKTASRSGEAPAGGTGTMNRARTPSTSERIVIMPSPSPVPLSEHDDRRVLAEARHARLEIGGAHHGSHRPRSRAIARGCPFLYSPAGRSWRMRLSRPVRGTCPRRSAQRFVTCPATCPEGAKTPVPEPVPRLMASFLMERAGAGGETGWLRRERRCAPAARLGPARPPRPR
jgi:hypothetical protein